jgi:hypothetical protein
VRANLDGSVAPAGAEQTMIVAGLDTIPGAVKGVPPFAKFILNETASSLRQFSGGNCLLRQRSVLLRKMRYARCVI